MCEAHYDSACCQPTTPPLNHRAPSATIHSTVQDKVCAGEAAGGRVEKKCMESICVCTQGAAASADESIYLSPHSNLRGYSCPYYTIPLCANRTRNAFSCLWWMDGWLAGSFVGSLVRGMGNGKGIPRLLAPSKPQWMVSRVDRGGRVWLN